MKNCRLLALLLPLLLCACSENEEEMSGERGTLYISPAVIDLEVSHTRADADVNGFTLILENTSNPEVLISGLFSDFPGGAIENIPVGNYTLTLTSHPDGFTPAFDDPWYRGIVTNIVIKSGVNKLVRVDCTQANAGIGFIFDPALEAMGFGDIVPEMKQGSTTLYFEGDNRNAKAYFLPEKVELRIKQGDEYLMLGGKECHTLDLKEQELWQATLKPTQITGYMGVLGSVRVIKEPNRFIEFEFGQSEPITIIGLSINAYTASFLAKGVDIEAVKYGLFFTNEVEARLNFGQTLDKFIEANGFDLDPGYLRELNSEQGLEMNFDRMAPETDHTLLIMSSQHGLICTQRYDFNSGQSIMPDPVQDPGGPVVPGFYRMNILELDEAGESGGYYENDIRVLKANQDYTYIVSYLFNFDGFDLIAKYDPETAKLIFTGKDIQEYDVFNDISLIMNQDLYAGIFLMDDGHIVDELIFDIKDRKLEKSSVEMTLRIFNAETFEDLGCIEMSPVNNLFTYKGVDDPYARAKINPKRNFSFCYPAFDTRSGTTRAKGKLVLRASVIKK